MKNIFTLLFYLVVISLGAQELPTPQTHLEFWANYTLPGNASQIPGNYKPKPQSRFQSFQARQNGFVFQGMMPTEHIENVLDQPFPTEEFTLELSILHHVHRKIAAAIYLLDQDSQEPLFLMTYHNPKGSRNRESATVGYSMDSANYETAAKADDWWYHLVLTYKEGKLRFYLNGTLQSEQNVKDITSKNTQLDLAAYLDEPYMELANMIKEVKIYDRELSTKQIEEALVLSLAKRKKGEKYDALFHFNAGPYLHLATKNSVNILWETNMPASAVLEYGTEVPLKKSIEVAGASPSEKGYEAYIQEITIPNLEPHTKYFYNIKLRNLDGVEMESGIYSFQTAVRAEETYQFAAIGDTETRPHINNQISQQIWSERPDFVIHLGDLTDGGKKNSKWQWNYEYFEGMSQLHARIPVFPVPGNGEGQDLYWYKKYHRLGEEEAFYTFNYGNSAFFMLNSNARKEEFKAGGKQYQWLDEQLEKSTAKWNFVCMHHAPYSTDENDYGNSWEGKEEYGDKLVKQLIPVFEKHQVDIVFFGHLHTYSRMGPIAKEQIDNKNGVWYIQTGGAGGNLEDFGPTRAWFSEKVYAGHHYCLVNINQGKLVFKMYDTEGRLKDYMVLEKE